MAPSVTTRLPVSDFVGEVLAGLHGHEGVCAVATHPETYGAAEALRERTFAGGGWIWELVRSKYKPARKLTGYYVVRSGRRPREEHPVAISWWPQGQGVGHQVLVSPADPAMPQLGRLTLPAHVAARVGELTGSTPEGVALGGVATVRYRPGQRHVLVARSVGGARSVFVKTDRDDSGARAVPTSVHLRRHLARRGLGAVVAEPVGYCAEDTASLWWEAPGRPMSSLLLDGSADRSLLVARAGHLLRAMHEVPTPPWAHHATERPRAHRPDDEAAAVLRAAEHITALLPDVGRTCAEMVAAALQGLEGIASDEPCFSHGDFKSGNIMVHDEEPRVLDLDRCGWADPAMDLGKFLADLAWWCRTRRDLVMCERAFRDGYGPCDPARWRRADQWSLLFRLKHAARRCAVHDAGWPARVRDQVDRAGVVLAAGGA